MAVFKEIFHCRSCGSGPFIPVFSLGDQFVSNFVDDAESTALHEPIPLDLVLCDASKGGCGLLQLRHTVSPETLYRQYWYRSGVNQTMTQELHGIARVAESIVPPNTSDIVVDIGANDGTLLRAYSSPEITRIGFEPAKNLISYAEKGTSKIFNDFFSAHLFSKEFGSQKAKIITAIAMFYDLDDPNPFVRDVQSILHPEGLFIIQMSYLPAMLKQNAFDNIVHEHLEYYSLLSLEHLLKRHDLEVFDVEENDVNGGSFRIYIGHAKTILGSVRPGAQERVEAMREKEEEMGLSGGKAYEDFAKRVSEITDHIKKFIDSEVASGKKVYAYGASTKGNTLLQFCGLDHRLIGAAAERNPIKWGKKTVATLIPIIPEEEARAQNPDYFLVLPWHFLPEFIRREEVYLKKGGKFVVPLPEFRVIGSQDIEGVRQV